jgi:hypothetical protein
MGISWGKASPYGDEWGKWGGKQGPMIGRQKCDFLNIFKYHLKLEQCKKREVEYPLGRCFCKRK